VETETLKENWRKKITRKFLSTLTRGGGLPNIERSFSSVAENESSDERNNERAVAFQLFS
jgi:hypothetical protein